MKTVPHKKTKYSSKYTKLNLLHNEKSAASLVSVSRTTHWLVYIEHNDYMLDKWLTKASLIGKQWSLTAEGEF